MKRLAASGNRDALIGDNADHAVGVEQSPDGEKVEIAMDINLDLTEVRKNKEEVGRARGNVTEKARDGARLETVEAMVDVYKSRMLYSDEELLGHLWERYKSEREEMSKTQTLLVSFYRLPKERSTI